MKIQLSDHFSYSRLLRFVIPSVVMMIFTSVYGVVDGIFVSNFVGKTPFTAINFIMPFLMLFPAFGFMVGTGGSALVSKTMGRGFESSCPCQTETAHRYAVGCFCLKAVVKAEKRCAAKPPAERIACNSFAGAKRRLGSESSPATKGLKRLFSGSFFVFFGDLCSENVGKDGFGEPCRKMIETGMW